jgi:cytochrome c peroxidase
MTRYDAWVNSDNPHRAAIARGVALFNAIRITITGVGGLNDDLGAPVILGSCTSCHDLFNVGNHSVALPIDIGLTNEQFRTPDMPLYTLRTRATGQLRKTSDPGRALLTGKWKDIGKFKGPVRRGLASRALLPQRPCRRLGRGGGLLRYSLLRRLHRPGEGPPDRVPQRAVSPLRGG